MAASNVLYDVGDVTRLYGVFKKATFTVTSGVPAATYALADPTTVSLAVTTPAGVTTTYTYAAGTVTKDSTGVYYREVTLTARGAWEARWDTTGNPALTERQTLEVV